MTYDIYTEIHRILEDTNHRRIQVQSAYHIPISEHNIRHICVPQHKEADCTWYRVVNIPPRSVVHDGGDSRC